MQCYVQQYALGFCQNDPESSCSSTHDAATATQGLQPDSCTCIDSDSWIESGSWVSDTLSQTCTGLQSPIKCLDHRDIVADTVCSQAGFMWYITFKVSCWALHFEELACCLASHHQAHKEPVLNAFAFPTKATNC